MQEKLPLVSQIQSIVATECISKRPPSSEEHWNQWQNDPLSRFREGYSIKPLPEMYKERLEGAIAEWIEHISGDMKFVLEHYPVGSVKLTNKGAEGQIVGEEGEESKDWGPDFDQWFDRARNAFITGADSLIEGVADAAYFLERKRLVGFFELVEFMAVFLPQAVDQSQRTRIALQGRRAAALHYVMLLDKIIATKTVPTFCDRSLAKCDAAWEIASSLGNIPVGLTNQRINVEGYRDLCEKRVGSKYNYWA